MKKLVFAAVLTTLCAASLHAQSAKSTLQIGGLGMAFGGPSIATTNNSGWQTVFGNASDMYAANAVRLHTSQQKDLIFGTSFECGVYTQTLVKSKGNQQDTSSAEATVEVRIKVDPGTANERTAYPGQVTFCNRYQELSATLQGVLELACTDSNLDGNLDSCNLDVMDYESVELVQRTLNANAFFFAMEDLGSGTHNIVVEARITSSTDWNNGSAAATALIGKGAVTVEEARLVKSGDIEQ